MRRALIATALALAAVGCGDDAPTLEFPVTFVAQADEPLAGVAISLEGEEPLGTTDADGLLRVTLTGREGTQVPFRVTCPDGFRPPREMPSITLRRFVGLDPLATSRGVEVSIDCAPAERMAAVVVKAGYQGLPVLAQGMEIARTGPGGVAHALIKLPPGSTFRVLIDTSTEPRLRPQSPATTLTIGDADEIFVIDRPLTYAAPARKPKARPKPRPVKQAPERLN